MWRQHLPGGFIVLESGQSHSAQITLAQRYDFRRVGGGSFTLALRNQTVRRQAVVFGKPGEPQSAQYFTAERLSLDAPVHSFTLAGDLQPVPYTLAAADVKFDMGDSQEGYDSKLRAQYRVATTRQGAPVNMTCTDPQKQAIVESALHTHTGLNKVIKSATSPSQRRTSADHTL